MSGKGDRQRPRQITAEEEDLRWELISSKTTEERKQEILELLDIIHQENPADTA